MTLPTDAFTNLQHEVLGLRAVLNNLGAYVFTKDTQGRYTFANQQVCELFGQPLADIIGRDDSHFFDLNISDQLRENDLRVLIHGEVIEREELNIVRPSGNTRIYWTVKAPVRDAKGLIIGMCGISTDITERKALESELRHQQQLLDAIVNNVDAHVYVKTRDRRFLYVNHKTAALFGLPADQVRGRLDEEVLPKRTADDFWALDHKVFESGLKQSGEESLEERGGELRHYWTVKVPIQLPDESEALIGFSTDITELHRLKEELQHQAHFDALTDVKNRRSFFHEAEKEFAKSQRYAHPLSIMMLDLDHFKRINDTYGHKVGDLVLKAFADHCKKGIRDCDTLGRVGGEEFAILMPNTDLDSAFTLAQRLCNSTATLQTLGDWPEPHLPTASIGVAMLDAADSSFDGLLERADRAMYEAKTSGRNRVCLAQRARPRAP